MVRRNLEGFLNLQKAVSQQIGCVPQKAPYLGGSVVR
jgi:hypothetical protein